MEDIEGQLATLVPRGEGSCGLAIIVGNTGDDENGVEEDMETMADTFHQLGLAIWVMKDQTTAMITGAIQTIASHTFPPDYKYIIFYFAGHGGSQNNRAFIWTADFKDESLEDGKLYIEEGIISRLLPQNTPNLSEDIQRIFLFDSYLEDDFVRACPRQRQPMFIPQHDNVVTASYTSSKASERTEATDGGTWTRSLSETMIEKKCPVSGVKELVKKLIKCKK